MLKENSGLNTSKMQDDDGQEKPGRRISRRGFMWSLGGLAASTLLYMRCIEPEWLEVKQQRVDIGLNDSRPVRLLHLSDLHVSGRMSTPYICTAIQRGIALLPDLIVVTGDFYTSGDEAPQDLEQRVLPLFNVWRQNSATPEIPVFAVFGNHDGSTWAARRGGPQTTRRLETLLEGSAIEVLHNRSTTVRPLNREISLVGIGDLWGEEFKPAEAFSTVNRNDLNPKVVLAHNPDTKQRIKNYSWDLMLSGHTHGGQLSLPLIGEPYAPVKDKRFVAGLYAWEGRQLHISKGIGNMRGLRLGARPDVTLLELV